MVDGKHGNFYLLTPSHKHIKFFSILHCSDKFNFSSLHLLDLHIFTQLHIFLFFHSTLGNAAGCWAASVRQFVRSLVCSFGIGKHENGIGARFLFWQVLVT
jgi:hypothetical protein